MYKNMSTDELAEIFVDNLVATNRGFNFYVNWGNALDYRNFEIELKVQCQIVLVKPKLMINELRKRTRNQFSFIV